MLKIAIVTSDASLRDELQHLLGSLVPYVTAAPFQLFAHLTAAELFDCLDHDGHYSLVLIDADLDGGGGVEVARSLRGRGRSMPIALLRSKPIPAADLFEVDTCALVDKPVQAAQLEDALAPQIKQLADKGHFSIPVKHESGVVLVSFDEVVCAMAKNRDQIITLLDGSQLASRMSSTALFKLLADDGRFFKVSASCIVNLDMVELAEDGSLFIGGPVNAKVAVPQRQRKGLVEALRARKRLQ